MQLVIALLAGLALTGCGSDEPTGSRNAAQADAVAAYRSYLLERSALLEATTRQLARLLERDQAPAAMSRYGIARVRFGQIEPASELFPALDRRIDEAGPQAAGGFHRIERELWLRGASTSLVAVARRLVADIGRLRRRIRRADLDYAEILAGAGEVLREVSASEVRGREEPRARIDLVDVSANVEGVDAAFEAAAPAVEETEPELAAETRRAIAGAYEGVANFGIAAREPHQSRPAAAGTSFVLYYVRTAAEYRELDRRIKALAEVLSRVESELAG